MKWNKFFKGLKEGQKSFGEDIAEIINLILLGIVYLIGVGLTFIIARIFGKHFLELKIDKNRKSYWGDLKIGNLKKEEYYRQF